ncbi:hypothetical protein [Endothiovibrio diazotrophicus]
MQGVKGTNLLGSLLSLLLLAIGMAGSSSGFMALAFLGLGLVGLANMMKVIQDWRNHWSLSAIHGSALLIWYGIGAFIGLGWGTPWDLGMIDHRDDRDLFFAALFVALSAHAILAVAPLEHRWWHDTIARLSRPAPPVPQFVLLSLALLWLVLVDFVLEGRIEYRSFGADNQLPITEHLLYQFSIALSGYFGWLVGKRREGAREPLILLALLFLPLLTLILMGQGRRELAAHFTTFFLIFAWSRDMRLNWRPLALFLAVTTPLFIVTSTVFQAQRMDIQQSWTQWEDTANLLDRIGAAADRFEGDWNEVIESQTRALPSRMFIIDYLKELGGYENPRFGLGRASAAELVMGIPSTFLPEKNEAVVELGGIGEMRNPDFGLADYTDYADSLLTVAYMDFGWFGIPYAALLTLISGGLLALLMRIVRNEFFQVIVLSLILAHYLTVEKSFVATTVNVLRLVVAIAPLTVLLSFSHNGWGRISQEAPSRSPP